MTEKVDVIIDLSDRDVVMGRLVIGRLTVEFLANVQWQGRLLELSAVHLYGNGANTLGIGVLRQAIQALMVLLDVDQVILDGAERVTGAGVGKAGTGRKVPRRLIFKREVT